MHGGAFADYAGKFLIPQIGGNIIGLLDPHRTKGLNRPEDGAMIVSHDIDIHQQELAFTTGIKGGDLLIHSGFAGFQCTPQRTVFAAAV